MEYGLKERMIGLKMEVMVHQKRLGHYDVYVLEDTGNYSDDDGFEQLVESGLKTLTEAKELAGTVIGYMRREGFEWVVYNYVR